VAIGRPFREPFANDEGLCITSAARLLATPIVGRFRPLLLAFTDSGSRAHGKRFAASALIILAIPKHGKSAAATSHATEKTQTKGE